MLAIMDIRARDIAATAMISHIHHPTLGEPCRRRQDERHQNGD
jgi:hypothetical protein